MSGLLQELNNFFTVDNVPKAVEVGQGLEVEVLTAVQESIKAFGGDELNLKR